MATIRALDTDVVALQEVSFYDVDGTVKDQPLELGRLTDRHVRYGAVHAYTLVEPESGRAIGTAGASSVAVPFMCGVPFA